jgi:hypothetical protein
VCEETEERMSIEMARRIILMIYDTRKPRRFVDVRKVMREVKF